MKGALNHFYWYGYSTSLVYCVLILVKGDGGLTANGMIGSLVVSLASWGVIAGTIMHKVFGQ